MTNIFSNCDSTIMGNSSNKEKDKEINGINIPKVPTFPTDNWSAVPLFGSVIISYSWSIMLNKIFSLKLSGCLENRKLSIVERNKEFMLKTLQNFAVLQIFLGFGK